jgi:hypothetical protein
MWQSNCIIHKEECGRSVTHNASNLPYIASYYRTRFTVSTFYPTLLEANHLRDNALVEARRRIESIPYAVRPSCSHTRRAGKEAGWNTALDTFVDVISSTYEPSQL